MQTHTIIDKKKSPPIFVVTQIPILGQFMHERSACFKCFTPYLVYHYFAGLQLRYAMVVRKWAQLFLYLRKMVCANTDVTTITL